MSYDDMAGYTSTTRQSDDIQTQDELPLTESTFFICSAGRRPPPRLRHLKDSRPERWRVTLSTGTLYGALSACWNRVDPRLDSPPDKEAPRKEYILSDWPRILNARRRVCSLASAPVALARRGGERHSLRVMPCCCTCIRSFRHLGCEMVRSLAWGWTSCPGRLDVIFFWLHESLSLIPAPWRTRRWLPTPPRSAYLAYVDLLAARWIPRVSLLSAGSDVRLGTSPGALATNLIRCLAWWGLCWPGAGGWAGP
jgi:hypothetical protein